VAVRTASADQRCGRELWPPGRCGAGVTSGGLVPIGFIGRIRLLRRGWQGILGSRDAGQEVVDSKIAASEMTEALGPRFYEIRAYPLPCFAAC
jgi:hypothetical protein